MRTQIAPGTVSNGLHGRKWADKWISRRQIESETCPPLQLIQFYRLRGNRHSARQFKTIKMDSNNSNYTESTTAASHFDITRGGILPVDRSIPVVIVFLIGTPLNSYIIWRIYRKTPIKKMYHYFIMLQSGSDIAQLTYSFVYVVVRSKN